MPRFIIRGGTVLGGPELSATEGLAIIIEDRRIVRIEPERSVSLAADDKVIDAVGHTVLPGLIDSHLHFFGSRSPDPMMWAIEEKVQNTVRAVADARKLVDSGFTTVRDLGSRNGVAIKRAVDEGSIIGPRTVPAHFGLSMTCGHGDVHNLPSEWLCGCSYMSIIVDGPYNVRKAVRQTIRDGADVVKIWTSGGTMSERDSCHDQHFTDEEISAAVNEAHTLRRKIAAHAEGILSARAAIRAGVDSIEHGFELDEECCEEMARRGTYFVPTLSLLDRVINTPGVPEYAKSKARPMYDDHIASFRRAIETGVRIGCGSDAFSEALSPFGRYNANELLLMHKAGMPSIDVLKAATISNAKLLGLDHAIGSLEVGKLADVIIVKSDVIDNLASITQADNIAAVIQGGIVIKRSDYMRHSMRPLVKVDHTFA